MQVLSAPFYCSQLFPHNLRRQTASDHMSGHENNRAARLRGPPCTMSIRTNFHKSVAWIQLKSRSTSVHAVSLTIVQA